MILAVFILLLIILLIIHKKYDQDYTSPSFLFVVGFTICSFVGCLYIKEWSLGSLSIGSLYFLICGPLVFFVVEIILRKRKPLTQRRIDVRSNNFVPISCVKLILFLGFQIISYYMFSRFQMSLGGGNLSESLAQIDHDAKYEGILVFPPWYINIPNQICISSGYLWACLLSFYIFKKGFYKQKLLIILNYIISTLATLLGGSRMVFLENLIALTVMIFIIYRFKSNWKVNRIPKRIKIFALLATLLFGALFGQLGALVGRDTSDQFDTGYLFAVYCGAETKNLDIYISSYKPATENSSFFLRSTFNGIYKNISDRGLIKLDKMNSARTDFNTVNGFFLGNVASCYATYYDDLEYGGLILVLFFSAFMYLLYRRTLNNNFFINGRLNLWIIFYVWLAYTPFMSFFAEVFFSRFTIEGLIRYLFYWWLIIIFLQGTKKTYFNKINNI